MSRAADEVSRAVVTELGKESAQPRARDGIMAESLADMLPQILPTAVAFDDPGAAWVRAPLFRLVHALLLHLAVLEVTVEEKRKVVTERVQDCATVLSSARPSVEVEFVLEEVSALESSIVEWSISV